MLSGVTRLMLLLFIGLSVIMILSHHAIVGYRQNTIVEVANSSIRSAALASRDYSSRINQGELRIQQDKFEEEFVRIFNENYATERNDFYFYFDYLKDDTGGIRGIRVEILNDEDSFQTTTILNAVKNE